MRIKSIISHASVGCAAALATYLAASGQLGVPASFAQAPAPPSGLRSTELFKLPPSILQLPRRSLVP